MAAVAAPAADQTANLMKNLTLDAQTKVLDAAEATKKPSSIQYGFANGGEGPNAKVPSREPTLTPLLQEMNQMIDPVNMCYLPNGYPSAAYFNGGYDGSEWENYQTYVNHEGVEMPNGLHTQKSSSMVPAAPAFQNKMYPNNQMYGQFWNTLRTGFDFESNNYDSRINECWSLVTDNKYNIRGRGNGYGYGNENPDGFSELSRGPRAGRFNPKTFGPNVLPLLETDIIYLLLETRIVVQFSQTGSNTTGKTFLKSTQMQSSLSLSRIVRMISTEVLSTVFGRAPPMETRS